MNKVLVTGLGVGSDFGVCQTCNLDFTWLVRNSLTLIWADKIILTSGAWNAQINSKEDKLNKAINIILHTLKDNNIIEIIEVKEMFTKETSNEISNMAENDMNIITKKFFNSVQKGNDGVPGEILIDGYGYCQPYVSSIYASMKVAESIGANCLFNRRDYEYLKYKYGIDNEIVTNADSMSVLSEIFNLYIPNELVLHNFAFESDERCNKCIKNESCKDGYLSEIERNIYKMINWRQYDEIYRAKEELEKIINIKSQLKTEVDVKEVEREFKYKQNKINTNIREIFPVIKRWTNLTTVVATPLSIYSATTGNKNTMILASGALGIAKATDEYIKYYENKNKWVGFINKNIV